MNQKIQELAEKATIRVNNPTVNSNGKVIRDNWEEGISISKFAELIVQECVTKIADVPNGYRDYRSQIEDRMRDVCIQSIKQYFGVEE